MTRIGSDRNTETTSTQQWHRSIDVCSMIIQIDQCMKRWTYGATMIRIDQQRCQRRWDWTDQLKAMKLINRRQQNCVDVMIKTEGTWDVWAHNLLCCSGAGGIRWLRAVEHTKKVLLYWCLGLITTQIMNINWIKAQLIIIIVLYFWGCIMGVP